MQYDRADDQVAAHSGGYRVPPTSRAVTIGNEAPPAGLASKVPDGSAPSTLAWPSRCPAALPRRRRHPPRLVSSERSARIDALGSKYVQESQSLGVMGSFRRGVQHEMLVAVGEREGVAVDGDLPDDRVPERLREHRRRLHVMPLPEPGELGAAVAELLDEAGHRGIRRVPGEDGTELHDGVVPELGAVGDPVQRRAGSRRPEERPAREVAVLRGEPGEVLHERGREVVPREHLERRGRDEGSRLREPLEEREDARADVAAVQPGPDRRGARQDVEVAGLRVGEPQRARDPREDLARRARRPALLKPDIVLSGDVREDRDLLTAQPRRPAPRSEGEADVLRPEPLATTAEERPEFLLVHTPSLPSSRPRILVPPVPGSGSRAA